MATRKTLERVSDKVDRLLDLYPIDLSEPKETNAAMRESLARTYADPHMRAFFENAVKYGTRSLIKARNTDEMIFYKSRIETLLQLLNMSKQHFVHFEMMKKRGEPLRAVENLVDEIKLR